MYNKICTKNTDQTNVNGQEPSEKWVACSDLSDLITVWIRMARAAKTRKNYSRKRILKIWNKNNSYGSLKNFTLCFVWINSSFKKKTFYSRFKSQDYFIISSEKLQFMCLDLVKTAWHHTGHSPWQNRTGWLGVKHQVTRWQPPQHTTDDDSHHDRWQFFHCCQMDRSQPDKAACFKLALVVLDFTNCANTVSPKIPETSSRHLPSTKLKGDPKRDPNTLKDWKECLFITT